MLPYYESPSSVSVNGASAPMMIKSTPYNKTIEVKKEDVIYAVIEKVKGIRYISFTNTRTRETIYGDAHGKKKLEMTFFVEINQTNKFDIGNDLLLQ